MNISLEKAIEIATKRVLYPGLKPEDYCILGEDIAIRIAKLIVSEAIHIMNVEVKLYTYQHILNYRFGDPIHFISRKSYEKETNTYIR